MLLRQGATGKTVIDLQQRLINRGVDVGKPDGAFGPKTKSAVMAFQKAAGLAIDGIVGPSTWGALLGAPPPPPKPLNLIEVCKSYRSQPHQDLAITWLQGQIPPSVLDEFTKRWRQGN